MAQLIRLRSLPEAVKPPLRLAVTGGIGSGKTYITSIFQQLGWLVQRADEINSTLLDTDSEVIRQLSQHFPTAVSGHAIDRRVLAAQVFTDTEARVTLESIMHPRIQNVQHSFLNAPWNRGEPKVRVCEIPLLVETTGHSGFDVVLAVEAPLQLRTDRLTANRDLTLVDAKTRIAEQATDTQRRSIADLVLVNDEDGRPVKEVLNSFKVELEALVEENL